MMETLLPQRWCSPRIDECLELNPKIDKSEIPDDKNVHFVPMPAVEALRNKIDTSEIRKFGDVKKGYTPFTSKDVLFAKITPCMENGKMVVVPELPHGIAFGSTEFHVLRSKGGIIPEWVFYFVSSHTFRAEAEHNMTGAVGQRRVPIDFIGQHAIPLPPLNEQKRIVEKIEELFSEIDAGVASLQRAREQFGVYRQALLKKAFTGELTVKWRAEHPDQIEPAEQLLQRIRQEREARYQQQVDDWKAAVKEWEAGGEDGKKPTKPKKLPQIDRQIDNHSDLPKDWLTLLLGEISDVTGGLTKNAKRNSFELKIPYLRVANVYANELRLKEIKEIGVTPAEAKKVLLEKGDLLIVEGNGSLDQIGRVAAWNGSIANCGHQNHLIRARTYPSADYQFVLLYLLSPDGRSKIEKQAASTSGLHTLSVSKVHGLPVVLCSLAEQKEIVRILEAQFEAIEQNEREIDAALTRAEALRQSILKKAFSGQLVPQDPNDEPAGALLERIRQDREAAAAENSKKNAARSKSSGQAKKRTRKKATI